MFKYILISTLSVSLIGCSKFEEINTNPEATERVSAAMIATRVIRNMANQPTQKSFMQPYMLNKYIIWTENVEGFQYNSFGRGSLSFTELNDLHYMVEFAGNEQLAKSYDGLRHFVRAFHFFETTMNLGDIPYSEAVLGETDKIYFPKYDTQKEVFLGILNELELADQLFSEGTTFAGDIVYDGNTEKWRKLVNSYALNVLIQLSKREADADLNVRARFQNIVNNKPIFTSNSDNFELVRSDRAGQQYPFFRVGNNFIIYPMLTDELIERLKERSDRRLFYYAKPSPVQIAGGKTENDFTAYKGGDPSASFEAITALKSANDFSELNPRYTDIASGEPTQQLSYAQLCLILAEGAARGWISENTAADWYQKGVEASMQFIFDNTPNTSQFHHGMPLDNAYVSAYTADLVSDFPIEQEARIREIIIQKYLASFLQSEFAVYYDYRRTGYPEWKINPATNLNNDDATKVPTRWMYPTAEYNYNTENVEAAVARQFNGNDNIVQLMWILQ